VRSKKVHWLPNVAVLTTEIHGRPAALQSRLLSSMKDVRVSGGWTSSRLGTGRVVVPGTMPMRWLKTESSIRAGAHGVIGPGGLWSAVECSLVVSPAQERALSGSSIDWAGLSLDTESEVGRVGRQKTEPH
jgi:hypothetical protein